MDKIFVFKHYVNLYKFASIKLDEIINTKSCITICTNCSSLIAGLAFNVIRVNKHNINIILNSHSNILDNYINLILTIDKDYPCDLYFEYNGDEQNILCIK